MQQGLRRRIRERSVGVGVIGQGYVGLPLSLVFAEAGFRVMGFDTDPLKVEVEPALGARLGNLPGSKA